MPFKNPERSLTWPPGARTGEARIVVGSDTPDELTGLFNVAAAILFYVVDEATNKERGYFFIANTNENNELANPSLLYGEVQYPVLGNPHSATSANVKTNEVNIMMDNLIPLMRVFNLHISDIGGLTFQDGAFLGSIDTTFGTSNVDIALPTQDATGGIFRMAPDSLLDLPANTRGMNIADLLTVQGTGQLNIDSGGTLLMDAGSAATFNGTATFNDDATFNDPVVINEGVVTPALDVPNGEIHTAGLVIDGHAQGKGLIAVASATSNSGNYTTTLTDVATLSNINIEAGRAYEFRHGNGVQHSNAATFVDTRVRCTDMAAFVVEWFRLPVTNAAQVWANQGDLGYVRNTGGSDLVRSFTLQMSTSAGTGFHAGGASRARFFEIWDVGLATDFSHGTVIT